MWYWLHTHTHLHSDLLPTSMHLGLATTLPKSHLPPRTWTWSQSPRNNLRMTLLWMMSSGEEKQSVVFSYTPQECATLWASFWQASLSEGQAGTTYYWLTVWWMWFNEHEQKLHTSGSLCGECGSRSTVSWKELCQWMHHAWWWCSICFLVF